MATRGRNDSNDDFFNMWPRWWPVKELGGVGLSIWFCLVMVFAREQQCGRCRHTDWCSAAALCCVVLCCAVLCCAVLCRAVAFRCCDSGAVSLLFPRSSTSHCWPTNRKSTACRRTATSPTRTTTRWRRSSSPRYRRECTVLPLFVCLLWLVR